MGLQEWRGHEPDLRTAFEVGFATALEPPIVRYGAPVGCYVDRVSKAKTCVRDALGMLGECDSRMAVEDFGMPLNLMLGCSAVLVNLEGEGIELLVAMLGHWLARAPWTAGCRRECWATTPPGSRRLVRSQRPHSLTLLAQPFSQPRKITCLRPCPRRRLRRVADSAMPACDRACLRSTSGRSDR